VQPRQRALLTLSDVVLMSAFDEQVRQQRMRW
jgi:hypothetical protein